MKKLILENFKAHQKLEVEFNNKNLLLYGDNGSGKSSIFEALKVVFFEEEIKKSITKKLRPEDHEEAVNTYLAKYNNTTTNTNYNLTLQDQNSSDLNIDNHKVFMFDIDDLYFDSYLKLEDLLSKVFFNIEFNLTKYTLIETKVNILLEKFLEPNIKISIDKEEHYHIKVKDSSKNIELTKDIKRFFNEAKINLIILSILFVIIEEYKDDSKKNILVLDDFITSLDVSNRTFIMKHILDTFDEKFQVVILTHNVYFYNLIMYLINDIYNKQNKWEYSNLYEIGNKSKIYINSHIIKLDDIKKELKTEQSKDNPNFTDIGNKIRQKFERLLYEFSKILMIGGVEESNKILENLNNNKKKYFLIKDKKYLNANDLIIEIENYITDGKNIEDITSLIETYSEEDHNTNIILETINELKIYQKVMMHSQSHGIEGINPIKEKEAEKTIELLQLFQNKIKNLTNKKTDGA